MPDFNNGELTEEHRKIMESHGGFKQENIGEHYDELSAHYEQVYLHAGYHDPLRCAEMAHEFLQGDKNAEILDMGCGTGLVGQYLKEFGYEKVVGLDASQGMLEKAKEKSAYTELELLFLGQPDTFPAQHHNRYDAITASGILAEGHLDNRVFDEMLMATK